MTDNELAWLVAERPEPIALDPATTDRARRALLDHAVEAAAPRRARRVRPPLRRLARATTVAAVGAAAAVAVVVVAVSPNAPTPMARHHVTGGGVTVVSPGARQSLLQLADYIRSGPAPAGDATLVLRTQTYPHEPTTTAADLYTDSGQYFYAPTEAGLPAQIAADANQGSGFMARALAAARLAANRNVATARHDMAIASFAPGSASATAQQLKDSLRQVLATNTNPALHRVLQHRLDMLTHGQTLASPQAQTDNEVWMNSLNALTAGAGEPQVRAGVLRILATMTDVSVMSTTTDGQPALAITATAPALPANYREQLTINAHTGLPIQFTGGAPGKAPEVTTTYKVSRVTVAAIAAGRF